MNAKELRVGNWVMIDNYKQIEAMDYEVYFALENDFDNDKVEPIPLTSEILEQCGFVNNDLLIFEGYVKIRFMFNSRPFVLEIDKCRMPLHELKYVHQLQNLFFALSGEELKINLKQPA